MKVILIQNFNNLNKIKAFTEEETQEAINYASQIFAQNYREIHNVNPYHLEPGEQIEYYSIGKIKSLIAKYIAHPHPNNYETLNGYVIIYVVQV